MSLTPRSIRRLTLPLHVLISCAGFILLDPLLALAQQRSGSQPPDRQPATLALHPENPRYFLFRGKPAILVTSGEHYGAVLNRDFDFIPYLDELKAHGFNLTRTFAGTYREVPGSFGIPGNTLAPEPASYVAPWARSDVPGAGDGGTRFDLKRWSPEYFTRLEAFVTEAGKRGIVVELVFFCTFYDDPLWRVTPMNPANNIQGIGPSARLEAYAGKDGALTAAQEALVRKVVTELNEHDNLYYEICNEPYEREGLTPEWNDRMIRAIVHAEAALSRKHLIAQGIAVHSGRIEKPNPHVSVFNFHAAEPASVSENLEVRKVIADDETGGKGTGDFPYRSEGWEFLLAGGAVFSHLDFSFTPRSPQGKGDITGAPGGGGPAIRKQIRVLKEFIEGFDFIRMRPDKAAVVGKDVAGVLVEAGKAYAGYMKGGPRTEIAIADLPAGSYRAEWIDPRTGSVTATETLEHAGGKRTLASPEYSEDLALRLIRAEKSR